MREREADGRKKKKVEKWRRYEQGESTRSKVVTEDDDEDKSGNGDEKCEIDEVEDEVWIGRCVVVVFGEGWGLKGRVRAPHHPGHNGEMTTVTAVRIFIYSLGR